MYWKNIYNWIYVKRGCYVFVKPCCIFEKRGNSNQATAMIIIIKKCFNDEDVIEKWKEVNHSSENSDSAKITKIQISEQRECANLFVTARK